METEVNTDGHKFGLPELPIPSELHMKYRYDPVVKQVTNLIMKHGKLKTAQRVRCFNFLYGLIAHPSTMHEY
jgi:small subunit ribosomal protein S7